MRTVIECKMDPRFSHFPDLLAVVYSASAARYFRQIAVLHYCCDARKELRNALKNETSHCHSIDKFPNRCPCAKIVRSIYDPSTVVRGTRYTTWLIPTLFSPASLHFAVVTQPSMDF